MTAPTYVATKTGDTFIPGPGLPTVTATPQLFSDQPTLNQVIAAAGVSGVELRFFTTGSGGTVAAPAPFYPPWLIWDRTGSQPLRPATGPKVPVVMLCPAPRPAGGGTTQGGGNLVDGLDIWIPI